MGLQTRVIAKPVAANMIDCANLQSKQRSHTDKVMLVRVPVADWSSLAKDGRSLRQIEIGLHSR